MGLSQSKLLKPLNYSCHEMGHTWNPSCTISTVEVGFTCFYEAIKIYSSVYAFSTLLRGKTVSREMVKSLIANILQSSAFLTYNSFGFIWAFCSIGKLLGFSNYLTVGLVPAWICSFLAVLVERPSRRPLLAVYCGNVATESALTSLTKSGALPIVPHGETIVFAMVSSTLMYLYRNLKMDEKETPKARQKNGARTLSASNSTTNSNPDSEKGPALANQDFMFKLIKLLIGKEDQQVQIGNLNTEKPQPNTNVVAFVLQILSSYWKKSSRALSKIMFNCSSTLCPHKDTCLINSLKGFVVPFAFGSSAQILLNLIKRFRGKGGNKLFEKETFSLGLFLGSFGGIYKFSSCLFRLIMGGDSSSIAIPSGFLAGLSMLFYPSKAISVYALWKTMEILVRLGLDSNMLPRIPLFIELVYATATSVLFHLSITEPQSLKPSYFSFMNRITGDRVNEINRYLVDFECGTTASQMKHFFLPSFDLDKSGERLKEVWPKILEKAMAFK